MSHLTPRTTTVLIYHGDDLARLSELRRDADVAERIAKEAVNEAERAGSANLRGGDADPVAEARKAFDAAVKPKRDAYDAFVAEASGRALEVVLQMIGKRRFKELVLAHPPRMVSKQEAVEGGEPKTVEVVHEDDALFGVNTETLPTALLTYVDPEDTAVRTITAPEFSGTRECLAFVDDELSEGDFDKLWVAAFLLNRTPGADPKASLFSTGSPTSVEI